jgi:Xaa-Pro aminopeptidase
MSLRGFLVALFVIVTASCRETGSPEPAPPEGPPIPKPAPVGPLAAPAGTPEPRGMVGPTGTLGAEVYRARRQELVERAGNNTVLVINEGKWDDGAREGMDFYYLTGIDEPGSALLLVPGAAYRKEVLFLERRDVEAERWNGERAPLPNKALEVATGIGRIERRGNLESALIGACAKYGTLAFVGDFGGENAVLAAYRKAEEATLGCRIEDKHGTLAAMREEHDAAELALMRKAIEYTAKGHAAANGAARPGAREFEVKDAIEDAFRKAGSRHVAFDSITGSGPNSAVLHYPKDDRVMKEGDLIVVDIGAEAEYYAADVTRTLPVGGRSRRTSGRSTTSCWPRRRPASRRPAPASRSRRSTGPPAR